MPRVDPQKARKPYAAPVTATCNSVEAATTLLLGKSGQPLAKIAARRAIGEITREVWRVANREARSRSDLVDDLARVSQAIKKLECMMANEAVLEALRFLGFAMTDETKSELERLRQTADEAPVRLQIEGQGGNVSASAVFTMAPKQLLVILAQRVFQTARGLARLPGRGNRDFEQFLSLLWQLIDPNEDEKDWRRHFDTASGKTLAGRRMDIHLSARLLGDDIASRHKRRSRGGH